MAQNEILALDVAALSRKMRQKALSPVEVTEAYLERIAAVDEKLRCYITVTAEQALVAAKAAEGEISAGNWRGTFHGVPVALKDLLYTAGIRTTGGSKILADFFPSYDSTAWARLKAQGAVLLGKLNLHEFAYGVTSSNPHWGFVRNPYALDRIPGGSSGGSAAAVVAGAAPISIGTDTGGSIRIPAALCGCVGLKPTWGRVSRYGVIPLAYTMDHVGPIARTVGDAALMLQAIAGEDPNDSTASSQAVPDYTATLDAGIRGVRVGIVRELLSGLSEDVSQAFGAAMAQLLSLGASVDEVSIPSIATATLVNAIVTWAEAFEYHENWMRERKQDYGEDVRRLLEVGMMTTAAAYVRAQRSRARMLAEALAVLKTHDVLAAPASAIAAPGIGETTVLSETAGRVDVIADILRFTAPFDCTGQPALALPVGLARDGLPLAMQIVGAPFGEPAVIRVAAAYEAARGPIAGPKI
jgi:aspartyl-tRNA(Asn)/glutamyl-tRNA(Gln) amidotransferase subunit A